MFRRLVLGFAICVVVMTLTAPPTCLAQTAVLSAAPPNVEYQYQLNYPRLWGWPGPGLSLGGSLPTNGRQGISSFYGAPLPVPFGAGVYVNPFTYATRLPGPLSFGLAASTNSPNVAPSQGTQPISQIAGTSPMNSMGTAFPGAQSTADPSRRPVPVSSISTLERGRQIESFGDEKLKSQQWLQAYVNYRNAVFVADDLAEAHVRLGFACVALGRYSEAVVEFKRALHIDPTVGISGETLASIFGTESRTTRAQMTRSVAAWVKEDLNDQDRLFLLGVVLRFDEDKRADKILEAAYRLTGSGDHLLALMTPAPRPGSAPREQIPSPVPMPPETPKIPELHRQPLALH